jgi:Cys-rich four helix bundle protein (predicted Tat secretion target)
MSLQIRTKPHPIFNNMNCLRHCLGMYAMKDTSMAGCADAAYQLVVACGALQALTAVNSPHVAAVAKGVEQIWKACQAECEKFPKVAECKDCGESCTPVGIRSPETSTKDGNFTLAKAVIRRMWV